MVRIDQIAEAALSFDGLGARSFAQDWLQENPSISACAAPTSQDEDVRALAAALVELFAERAGQISPAWTAAIGPASRGIFLLRELQGMPKSRALCQEHAPAPLRRRRLFAPPNYLQAA